MFGDCEPSATSRRKIHATVTLLAHGPDDGVPLRDQILEGTANAPSPPQPRVRSALEMKQSDDSNSRAYAKEASRDADRRDLAAGRKSHGQLRRENEVLAPLAGGARANLAASRRLG